MMWRVPVVVVAGAVLTLSSILVAQQDSTALVSVAQGEPMELAMALADASIPVGLEVRVGDRTPRRRPDFEASRHASTRVEEVVSIFNESHSLYRAELVDGVVVIRPVTQRALFLDRPFEGNDLVATGATTALRRVFGGLDPRLESPGGVIGSRLVDPVGAGDHVTVTFSPGATVLRALNEIAAQTGQGWLVITERPSESDSVAIVEIGLLHHDGASSVLPVGR